MFFWWYSHMAAEKCHYIYILCLSLLRGLPFPFEKDEQRKSASPPSIPFSLLSEKALGASKCLSLLSEKVMQTSTEVEQIQPCSVACGVHALCFICEMVRWRTILGEGHICKKTQAFQRNIYKRDSFIFPPYYFQHGGNCASAHLSWKWLHYVN